MEGGAVGLHQVPGGVGGPHPLNLQGLGQRYHCHLADKKKSNMKLSCSCKKNTFCGAEDNAFTVQYAIQGFFLANLTNK